MVDVKMGLVMAVMVACGLAMNLARGASPLSGEMKSLAGEPVDLAAYKGKVVLVVNVASRCGYTRQYAGLQKLYDAHKDKGFVILGFPANDFGAQEPGSDAEIAEFCSTKYGVTFPMFAKITVKLELREVSDRPGRRSDRALQSEHVPRRSGAPRGDRDRARALPPPFERSRPVVR